MGAAATAGRGTTFVKTLTALSLPAIALFLGAATVQGGKNGAGGELAHNALWLFGEGDFGSPTRGKLPFNMPAALFQAHQRDRAIQLLDEADAYAAHSSDPFWVYSGGASGNLLRAADAVEMGEKKKAGAFLDRVSGLRPFAPSVYPAVDFVYSMIERNPADLVGRLEGRARISPDAYRPLGSGLITATR